MPTIERHQIRSRGRPADGGPGFTWDQSKWLPLCCAIGWLLERMPPDQYRVELHGDHYDVYVSVPRDPRHLGPDGQL